MKQLILVGNQKVKFQDTETIISLTLVSDGNTVTIDKNKTYSVKIKNGTGYVKSLDATPNTTNNMVTFSTSGFDGLPVDAYFIELWVIDTNGQTIYPSDSFIELDITANATGVEGQVLPAITMQEFEERFSTLQSNLETKVGTLIGPTGNGINTVVTEYQLSSSGSNVPTGNWSKAPVPQTDDLPYLWARTTTTYTDKSTHVSYNISAKGTKGNNFTIQGSTNSISGLPSTGVDGEGYMVGTELYVWTNGKWNDIVNMKGDKGDQGIQGIQGIKGDTGNGISSTTTEYQLGSSGSNVPAGTWSESPATPTDNLPYMWTRNVITYTDKSTHVSYNISAKGTKGNNFTIQGSTNSISGLPSTGVDGEGYMVGTELYVWTNGKWNDIVNMKGVQGDKGIQGIQGVKGDTGNGISSITTEYELSKQGTAVPSTGWSSTLLTMTNDLPYLWTRVTITFTDGSKNMVYFTSNKGDKGDTGEKGDKGDTGANLAVKGAVDKNTQLPSSGNTEGDAYLVGTNLYVYTNKAWKNCGPIIAENTVLYNADGSLNVNGTNYNYVQDLRNGKIQYNDGTKNIELTPVDSQQEAKDILSAHNYTDASISSLSNSINTKLSGYATNSQLATKADDSKVVHDNHDGTEQLNGAKVQPFNKLSDTIGGRNLLPISNYNSGYVNASSGSIVPADGTAKEVVSDFVPVDITQSYYCQIIQQVTKNQAWYGIGFYDSNQQFISRFANGNATITGTITSVIRMLPLGFPNISIPNVSTVVFPANTAYVRVSFRSYGNPIQASLEKSSVLSDWVPAPEDKVNVSDMRKPAGDVAGIEEVNAKQDKIGYTPANDSKVFHSTVTELNSTDMNTVKTAGFYKLNSGTNGMPNADAWTIYQIIHLSSNNGVQLAYGTNSAILGMRSWSDGNTFTSWVQFADDSKVVHSTDMRTPASNVAGIEEVNTKQDKIGYTPANDNKVVHSTGTEEIAGQKTFDTAPIDKTTGNPYITKSGVPKIDLSSYATNSQLATKADDYKVVHSTDMRKPASDVAGIEEVNAKQDKIGYTPADDSKVAHSTITELNSTDMNTVMTAGFYQSINGTNGIPSGDNWTIYQVIPLFAFNGVQLAYGTNNAVLGMRSWHSLRNKGIFFNSWVQFADDSKVAHLSGANNFDTIPTVNNNPLLLTSSLPAELARTGSDQEFTGKNTFDVAPIDKKTGNPYITKDGVPAVPSTLADTTKDANFTGKLQKSGIDVATTTDVTNAVSGATSQVAHLVGTNNFTGSIQHNGNSVGAHIQASKNDEASAISDSTKGNPDDIYYWLES